MLKDQYDIDPATLKVGDIVAHTTSHRMGYRTVLDRVASVTKAHVVLATGQRFWRTGRLAGNKIGDSYNNRLTSPLNPAVLDTAAGEAAAWLRVRMDQIDRGPQVRSPEGLANYLDLIRQAVNEAERRFDGHVEQFDKLREQ